MTENRKTPGAQQHCGPGFRSMYSPAVVELSRAIFVSARAGHLPESQGCGA